MITLQGLLQGRRCPEIEKDERLLTKEKTMNRKWLAGIAFFAVFMVTWQLCNAGENELMTKDELKSLLGNPDVIVLDVRTGGDYRSSPIKIQGALRENPIDVNNWAAKYSKDKTIVLYCS